MDYLVTGAAGFIGFHLAQKLLEQNHSVLGIDNFNKYYPTVLKEHRFKILENYPKFIGKRLDLCNFNELDDCFKNFSPEKIFHLAAQPGVRYSIINPFSYQKSNLEAFLSILEVVRKYKIKKLVYASSSSVYGNITETPYIETQNVDTPISLYAATKRANEIMAYTYTHLYGIQTIGLRFFTVYGPAGRPDMAIWKFADSILRNETIEVYHSGEAKRDFTYISDIVSGALSSMERDRKSVV